MIINKEIIKSVKKVIDTRKGVPSDFLASEIVKSIAKSEIDYIESKIPKGSNSIIIPIDFREDMEFIYTKSITSKRY